MKDSLGDRMKEYEGCFNYKLTKNCDYIIRLDGRHFHTLTRGIKKPFDYEFINIMREVAKKLLKEVQGCKFVDEKGDVIFNESMFKRECARALLIKKSDTIKEEEKCIIK